MNKQWQKRCLALLAALGCLLAAGCVAADEATAQTAAPADVATAAAAGEAVIVELCETEYDAYAYYYTPEEYRLTYEDYLGSFGGVGIQMLSVDGYVVVYQVIAGGPASTSEIVAGDRILAVDGQPIDDGDSEQAASMIRGDVGSEVTLTLQHEGSEESYQVTLTRDVVTSDSVEGEIIEEAPNTAYILIYDFTEQTADEFAEVYNALRDEQRIDDLIIDLRSNGGGSFFAAINIANYFVPAGEDIVMEKTAAGEEHYSSVSGQLNPIRLYILQNEGTASASEVLTGALRDGAQATVIGTTSYGKGITQSVIQLPSGSGLRYTRSRYYTPSGYDLHGVGIEPDIEVIPPQDITNEEYFSTDPQQDPHLQAAVELICSLPANEEAAAASESGQIEDAA